MRPANAPPPTTPRVPSVVEDPALVLDELRASGKDGVSLIVDGGHLDMGTNYDHLRMIAEKAGVHVVASGGYYLQTTYPPEVSTESEEQCRRVGARRGKYRWGGFGEIGSSTEMTGTSARCQRDGEVDRTACQVTHKSPKAAKACA